MEEKNRSLLCDGHTWSFVPVKARCSVKAREFCLEEAKRAIVKEIEKQGSQGAVSLKVDSRPRTGSEKVILSESATEYVRQVAFQGKGGERSGGQKGGKGKGKRGVPGSPPPSPRSNEAAGGKRSGCRVCGALYHWTNDCPQGQKSTTPPKAASAGSSGRPEQPVPAQGQVPGQHGGSPMWQWYGCFACGSLDNWKWE